jgi:hypothetical protein
MPSSGKRSRCARSRKKRALSKHLSRQVSPLRARFGQLTCAPQPPADSKLLIFAAFTANWWNGSILGLSTKIVFCKTDTSAPLAPTPPVCGPSHPKVCGPFPAHLKCRFTIPGNRTQLASPTTADPQRRIHSLSQKCIQVSLKPLHRIAPHVFWSYYCRFSHLPSPRNAPTRP